MNLLPGGRFKLELPGLIPHFRHLGENRSGFETLRLFYSKPESPRQFPKKLGEVCEIAYPTLFSNRSSLAIFQFWAVLNRDLFLWTQRTAAGPNFEGSLQELTGQGISI